MHIQVFAQIFFQEFLGTQLLAVADSGAGHTVSAKSGALHPLFGRIYPTIYGKRGADS